MQELQLTSKQLDIVFEDEFLIAINKPSGLASQSTAKGQINLYDLLCKDGRWPYIGMHQRLDLPTSGLILFTKKKSINEAVAKMFLQHNFEKTYLCLCKGVPQEKMFTINNRLKSQKLRNGKTLVKSVKEGGDEAWTTFQVLEEFQNKDNPEKKFSLIQAQPKTGRMHQIRVHLNETQNPILGDALYFRADRKFPRLMLHAFKLKFQHPHHQNQIEIEAPIPEDYQKAIDRLKNKSE
jgi:RluA family pseudouridine synthase